MIKDELIGFDVLEEETINCADCGIPLAEVVVVETNEDRRNRKLEELRQKCIVKNCPKCGGSSLPTKIFEGSIIAGTLKDEYSIDIEDTEFEDDCMITILSIRGKKK